MIIIDSNAICHREAHALGDRLSYEEKNVGIIFGFLREILKLSRLYETNEFAFCWDSRKSLRKQIYPEYKNKPKKTELDPKIFEQFETIKTKVLPEIGFKNIFEEKGFEADDLIASLVTEYPDNSFVITSSDEDLYQLLRDNVCIYNLYSKKEYTKESFNKEFGISCCFWSLVKAIAGCSSDNVKGIKGVGEKTAIKYIKEELPIKSKAFQNITSLEGTSIVKRNFDLVRLPFEGTPFFDLKEDTLSLLGFMTVCKRFGFSSILKDVDIYKERLKLQ